MIKINDNIRKFVEEDVEYIKTAKVDGDGKKMAIIATRDMWMHNIEGGYVIEKNGGDIKITMDDGSTIYEMTFKEFTTKKF
jgi:hypothetical protein